MVDAHWHGAMGEDGIVPQQSWVDYSQPGLQRDHRARSVERHRHHLHAQ
ncbi:hypothetical protein LP420_36220 [Massilia sp. B-10]|nr:hypothetical protein LP420_36220 [Massilia sp. B-10]